MTSSNFCFLTCIQVSQKTGKMVWYSHFFKNFLQFLVIHTIKGFNVVKMAEIDIFLELSSFLLNLMNIGSLISASSAFSKPTLNIWKFLIHVLLKPSLKDFEHNHASVWNKCSCVVVWTFFGIALLWDWLFPVLWPLLSFPNFWHIEHSAFTASCFRIWNSSAGILSAPLSLFIVMLLKAHLTLYSRMSGSRWVTTPLQLSEKISSLSNTIVFLYFFALFI